MFDRSSLEYYQEVLQSVRIEKVLWFLVTEVSYSYHYKQSQIFIFRVIQPLWYHQSSGLHFETFAEMAVQPSKDQSCLARSSSGLSLLESGRKLFLQSETAKHLLLNTVISQSSCFKKQVTKESESQVLSFTLAIGKDIQLSLWWHTYVSTRELPGVALGDTSNG